MTLKYDLKYGSQWAMLSNTHEYTEYTNIYKSSSLIFIVNLLINTNNVFQLLYWRRLGTNLTMGLMDLLGRLFIAGAAPDSLDCSLSLGLSSG